MATISPDTFDPLRRFVSVRLQQGVPIVDADVNELDDIRRFEVRAFLKWFVGDGIPEGTDGFRIEGTALSNDFMVRFGGGVSPPSPLSNAGRLIADGRDVLITADTAYTAQPLHEDQAGAPALAAFLGVPVIAHLTTPVADGTVTVYIDIWDRIVTPAEDPSLIMSGLGTESCARLKREFVIRTRAGVAAPVGGDPDFIVGHSYYALARIARLNGDAVVGPGAVTDVRERRLLIPPATLVTDVFGVSPSDYRRGLGRPPISVREAVNSLIRGQIPSTPDSPIPPPGFNVMRRSMLFGQVNTLAALWTFSGGPSQVFGATLDTTSASPLFGAPVQITAGVTHSAPHAALLPNGDLFVLYEAAAGANRDIFFKRAPFSGLAAEAEQVVANTAGAAETQPFVVVSGILAVCFHHLAGASNTWQFRRRQWTNNTWVDLAPQQLSALATTQVDFHAAVTQAGDVWCAFRSINDIHALRFTPSTGLSANQQTFDSGTVDQNPFVLVRSNGDVWIVWNSGNGLQLARFTGAAFQPMELVPGSTPADAFPSAAEDGDGGIWLFFQRLSGTNDIFVMYLNPLTGTWAPPRQVTFNRKTRVLSR